MNDTTAEPQHKPCPVCQKPVRGIARPPQPHRHMADHGPQLGTLCPGSGKPITP